LGEADDVIDDEVIASLTSTHSSWLWRHWRQELRLDNQRRFTVLFV